MINRIETDRLILRKAKLSDLDNIYNNIWSDSSIADNMLWKLTENIEEATNRLNRTIKYQSNHYAYFICLKDTDEVIGFVGIFEKDKDIYEDTGICIASNYQHNGYGKEVLKAIISLVFNNLEGRIFLYSCFKENINSQKLCTSLGFIYKDTTNTIREYDNKNFKVDYYYLDKNMYQKLTQ